MLGLARAVTTRKLGAEWLPTDLPSLIGWYSATRSTFSLTGSAVNQWNNAGPATPDLVTGTAPTLTTGGDGIDFVRFDGTNDFLSFATTLSALVGTDNFSFLCAVKIRSNSPAVNIWDQPSIVTDANELFGLHITGASSPFGAVGYIWDGDEETTTPQNVTANTLAVIQFWHNGTSINLQLDEGSPVTNACGAIIAGTGNVTVGLTPEAGTDKFAAIDLYDLVVTNAAVSAPERALYYDFVQSEYVAEAPPSFVALGADFNGTTQYGSRGAGLTSAADSKVGILSVWLWFDTLASNRILLQSAGAGTQLSYQLGLTEIILGQENSAGTIIHSVDHSSNPSTGAWHHLLISWNLATAGTARLYFDDVSSLTENTYTNDTIDYTKSEWTIGADNVGSARLEGRMGELYFNTAEYLDFDVEANRRKFISAGGAPVDLGVDGSTPTGNDPIIYCSRREGDDPDDFLTNRGYGGGFTVNGSPLGDGGTVGL